MNKNNMRFSSMYLFPLLISLVFSILILFIAPKIYSYASQNFNNDLWVSEDNDFVINDLPDLDKSIQSDLSAGNYYISASYNLRMCVDVYGGGNKDGANIDIYTSNCNTSQKWKISYDTKGYATITNYAGKVLDVYGGEAKSGANVIQYKNTGDINQKWIITKDLKGYKIKSALSKSGHPDLCLDVFGSSSSDGANIEIFTNNNGKNQRFVFTPIDSQKITGEKVIEDGEYSIRVKNYQNKCIDVCAGSGDDGANVDLWTFNGGQNQIFHFKYDENTKCYTIFCVGSAKVLNVHMANPIPGSNVNQYINKNLDEEKWAITKKEDGGFLILNRYSGLSLDVDCGIMKDGSNVSTYTPNGGFNQNFVLNSESLINNGVYTIMSYVANDRCLDIPRASCVSGTQLETYSGNFGINQKYVIKSYGKNKFTIRSVCSGLLIGQSSNKIIQTSKEDDYAKWNAIWVGNGVAFENNKTGKVMDVEGMSSALGARLIAYNKNGCKGQAFRCVNTDLVSDGFFTISPKCALSNSLNIENASWSIGAQVFTWTGNNDYNSRWCVQKVNSNYYRIVSAMTEYVIDVTNGSCHDNDRIQQWGWNGGTAQLWKLEFTDDGWFTFVNATNGLCLDCLGQGKSPGNQVGIYHRTGSSAQKWRLTMTSPVSFSGNAELDMHLRNICRSHSGLNSIYNFVSSYDYRDGDLWPTGDWTVPYALDMIHNGSGNCYRYAALFMWCARALNFNANVVCGQLATVDGGRQAHGWVEIYCNGTYVCDPELQYVLGNYNFYMITYANAPVTYYK